MDPLKAAGAVLLCLALFVLALRLTRRLMEMAIAAGHAEALRRAEAEDDDGCPGEGPAPAAGPEAEGTSGPAAHTAGAVP